MSKINIKSGQIWLSVLILLICIGASIVLLTSKMQSFLLDDSGAIPLFSNSDTSLLLNAASNNADDSASSETAPALPAGQQHGISSTAALQEAHSQKKPGLEVSDENTVWATDTQVEIFRVSYANGQQVITVNSDNGDNLIAPGTENSYTFKLKNTGKVALDYTVSVDAYFTPGDIAIPITGRISRYDGKWIAGNQNAYVDVKELDQAEDKATLGAGRYSYYILDWLWPFESGNDQLDTLLGDMAVDEDLIFTIVITTAATANADPNKGGGIKPPQTGDNSNITLWLALLAISFVSMILLIFLPRRKKYIQ